MTIVDIGEIDQVPRGCSRNIELCPAANPAWEDCSLGNSRCSYQTRMNCARMLIAQTGEVTDYESVANLLENMGLLDPDRPSVLTGFVVNSLIMQ